MKTWLYLTTAGLAAPSAGWPCCVWSSTGQRQLMPLSEAARALNGQAVDVLLPMELCSWVRSDPWPSRRQPSAQAIAFAVEEQLGEAMETLHLSVGARDREGRYAVVVIDRQRFAAVLARLTASGIVLRSVFVDADVLPAQQAFGVWWFGRWVLGGGLPARLAIDDAGLAALKPGLPKDIRWLDERQDLSAAEQWLMQEHGHAINLLQGEFAPRHQPLPWRFLGLALLLVGLLTWGASETRIHHLDSESRRLSAQNEQRFRALYPQQTRIVDLAAQLQTLQNPQLPASRTAMVTLVKLIEQVVGSSAVDVQRIEYRAGDGWKIQLIANSFAELEQLRERGRQHDMPVKLDSSNKVREGVQATLTLEDGV
ncbi:type II secretion system protein GspL [Pseudomonas frederiksbergensis]|uniref:type II secretion system protein GspL n=1 Tax=Pseudomonas frederiksbergensis TaxID=104087 RepID=UPI000F487B3D|nr:type II secretion system protein GspL [Pseudomonas frederiksbergensis]RON58964.1 type II secretory protein pull [Pseudomonas frederiksbergensis]